MTDATPHRAYLDGLPVGHRLEVDPDGLVGWSIFPFEVEGLRARVLQPPVLPEPPRNGETGPDDCATCARGEQSAIWADDDWMLLPLPEPSAVPVVVMLNPRAHHDLADLPAAPAADLGPLLQRVERAVMAVPGTGRVHVNKWGDGGAHLHGAAGAVPRGGNGRRRGAVHVRGARGGCQARARDRAGRARVRISSLAVGLTRVEVG